MPTSIPDPADVPDAVTDLILRIFRTNGRLLQAGDRLVAPLGLTSARWQVMGSIADAEPPLPVAGLARDMGVSRQAVQRIANDLAREGLVTFRSNPQHKRAQLIVLTEHGRDRYEQALALQKPWATQLSEGLPAAKLAAALDVLGALLDQLAPVNDRESDRSVSLKGHVVA